MTHRRQRAARIEAGSPPAVGPASLLLAATLALATLVAPAAADAVAANDRTPSLRDADLSRRGADRPRPAARRAQAVDVDAEVMPLYRRPHPRLETRARGSIAIGTVTEGFLVEPAELPLEGKHHYVLEKIAPRNTRFTTDEMRGLLLCAARQVHRRHRDQLLGLGNLSRAGGGDVPWSVSHNNGRDADIAFLARTPQGKAARVDHLYHFGRDLVAHDAPTPVVFDVAANWTLVRALITCERQKGVHIDYLFAANWLQRAMLRYARAADEPADVVARARRILHQPRRAAAHADHLHLRIGCPPDDLQEGCLDKSRAPSSAIGKAPAVRRRLPALRRALAHHDARRRAGAASLLGLYEDAAALPALQRTLTDADADVRLAAVTALLRIDAAAARPALRAALTAEDDPRVASTILRGWLEAGDVAALLAAIRDPRALRYADGAPLVVRSFAATLLGHSGQLAPLRALAAMLRDPAGAARSAARAALERLTNRSTVDLALAAGEASDEAGLWERFVAAIPKRAERLDVVLAGFVQRGLPISAVGRGEVARLAAALALPPPYSDNAVVLLGQALRYQPEDGRGARAAPERFWMPWLERRSLVNPEVVQRVRLGLQRDGIADSATAPAAPAL